MNNIKQSKKIALCGIISALSIAIMISAYFPYLTYAIPAMAGVLTVVLVVELGVKWAFLSFGITAVLSALMCEKEAAVVYILFFGYYPIIKYLLEKSRKPAFEYILKFLIFNVAAVAVFYICSFVLGIGLEEFTGGIEYMIYVLLIAANVMFIVFDYALNRLISLYYHKYHPKISKIIKR